MASDFPRKIKIIRIIARLNVGGPAVHALLLNRGLNNAQFKSLLISGSVGSQEEDALKAAQETEGIVVVPELQREIKLFADFIAFGKIFSLVRKERPDIIHTHTAKAGALGRLAGLIYNLFCGGRAKLIHTFHGTVLSGYFGRIKTGLFIWIERALARISDRIITVSNTLKDELLRLEIGDPERLRVIPLGLDMGQFLSLAPREGENSFNVGIAARLVPVKNHRMFLEGAKLFIQNHPAVKAKARFFIIGGGQLRPELEHYALNLGIAERVEFRGWMLKMADVYSVLDVVALTSLNEGTPLSLIEAMACGRPVIATDVGGVRDLFIQGQAPVTAGTGRFRLYENGILCKSSDAQGFADALSLMAGDADLRRRMGLAGRSLVKERFSKERLIEDIEVLYNNVLN